REQMAGSSPAMTRGENGARRVGAKRPSAPAAVHSGPITDGGVRPSLAPPCPPRPVAVGDFFHARSPLTNPSPRTPSPHGSSPPRSGGGSPRHGLRSRGALPSARGRWRWRGPVRPALRAFPYVF